jgi:hypothetical protein
MTTTQISSAVSVSERSRFLLPGLAAAIAAALGTMLVAAVLRAFGADYYVVDGEKPIPLTGFAITTFGFSFVGLGLAAALRRWSRRPRTRFVQVNVFLTALSLVPPFINDADAGTAAALVVLHLTAAAIAIPLIARRLAD